jgi:hypothetical protein
MSADKSFAVFLSDNSRHRAPIRGLKVFQTPGTSRAGRIDGMTTGMIECRGTAPLIWRSLNWSDRMTCRRGDVHRSAPRLSKAA